MYVVKNNNVYILEGISSIMKKIKCNNCGYVWKTKSKLLRPTCPSCRRGIKGADKNVPRQ
jgi:hypothetical protein